MPKLQVVWPKDGPGGSKKRGFVKGLRDIVGGKGPDMFLQRKGDGTAIAPEQWGNWDSYHNAGIDVLERSNPNRLLTSSRGSKRYDPRTRTYKHWAWPNDWNGQGSQFVGLGPNGVGYPRFTQREQRYIQRQQRRGRPLDFEKLDHWNHNGPERFRQEHDWFWQEAHRLGTNRLFGPLGMRMGPDPSLLMHQELPYDPVSWNW
ncbi:hypothetical protein BDZ45DRAFT_633260 [Acephala macrosclerotiorum]|nr:hypothetical protein BDZ45DRAFT_633260 [Acephala macrosclerotiorum]